MVLSAVASFLSKPFAEADFAFYGTVLSGTPEQQARWKRGVSAVSGNMGEEIGKVYVAKYFPPEAKAAADQLAQNIIAAMRSAESRVGKECVSTSRSRVSAEH